jgi:hypothetical protein
MHRLNMARAVSVVAATLAVCAPSALAAPTPSAACSARPFAPVFAAYHDPALYTLAPGGDFETHAAGWTLARGAAVAPGSSSIRLHPALGASSLALPAGASAVSPAFCVAAGYPAFRFAARGAGVLGVQVLYTDGRAKQAGLIRATGAWSVTHRLSLAQGLFQLAPVGTTAVRLKFTAAGGAARVDDVYVDPRLRR